MWFFRGIFGSIKNNAQYDMGTFPVFYQISRQSPTSKSAKLAPPWHRTISKLYQNLKMQQYSNRRIVRSPSSRLETYSFVGGFTFWAGKISNYMIWFSEIVVSWKSEQYLITVVFAIYFDNLINDSETFHFPKIPAYRIRF